MKIKTLMKNANLEEPVFLSDRERNTFSATFYLHQLIDAESLDWLSNFTQFNLSSKEARILVFAYKKGTITNSDGRLITGLDTLSVSKILTDLRKKGVLEQHSSGPGTYYTLSPVSCPTNMVTIFPSTLDGGKCTKLDEINTKSENSTSESTLREMDEANMTERSVLLSTLRVSLRDDILHLGNRLTEDVAKTYILRVCKERVCSAYEIAVIFGRGRFWAKKPLQSLVASGEISLTIPDKPNSRNQAYFSSPDDKQQKSLADWE